MTANRLEPQSLHEVRSRLAADRARLRRFLQDSHAPHPGPLLLFPPYLAVWLHRWSHYLFRRGLVWPGRLCWHLNCILTGADLSMTSDVGPGLLLPHPAGIAISGDAGRHLTVMALGGMGGEMGHWTDIGAGPGLPVVGDDVTLEARAGVLGPVRIGDRVRIMAGAVAAKDVPSDAEVLSSRHLVRSRGAES